MKNQLNSAELKRRSVAGVVGYMIRTGLLQVVAIVATGLLSAYLSPSDFGIYFAVVSIMGLFTFMSDVGLAARLVQQPHEPTKKELRTAFTVQIGLSLGIFVLTLVATPLWRNINHLDVRGLWLLYALAFSFVLSSLKTMPSVLLERQLQFNRLMLPQIFETLLFYGLAVYLARLGFGVKSYTVAILARSIVGVVVMYCLKRWPIGLALDKASFKHMFSFGFKFQLNDFLARIKDDLFIVFLAWWLPPAQMGYIGWAKRWSMFPYQFSVQNVIAVTFPTYSRLQDDKQRLAKAVEKSIFFIALIIFPVLAGMSIVAPAVLRSIPAYTKWLPAVPALVWFCLNIAFSAVTTPLTNTLNAIGKIGITLKLMMFWTALTWTLTPALVLLFGFTGVAVASGVIGSTSIWALTIIKKAVPIRFIRNIWLPLVATLVMSGVLLVSQNMWHDGVGGVLLAIAMGCGIYVSALAVLGFNRIQQEIMEIVRK
jgi:O-antigen/teichoic acid export membrane protein